MSREDYRAFAAKAESLVRPIDSTAISFLGDFNKYLPLKAQQALMDKGSRQIPYMGFIVDPYCLFLSYPIVDLAAARAMLPAGYELADTAIFRDEPKRPTVVISAFSVRTSVFSGMRVECYVIARRTDTGRAAWIIVDYETNTTSHDPKNGFGGYSCDRSCFATTPYAELLAEAVNERAGNRFSVRADIGRGPMRGLDQELWVEGNLNVDYGGKLKPERPAPFTLIFDPFLMKEARAVPLDGVEILANTLMREIIDGAAPTSAALFPYSQHFVIRQDLNGLEVATTADLRTQVRTFLEKTGFKIMSGDDIKKPLLRGFVLSAVFNAALIIGLVVKILFF
jgi:hypothetical protein